MANNKFWSRLLELIFKRRHSANSANSYDVQYNSPVGYFDVASGCAASGGNGAGIADMCCGMYPLRFPFHSDNGNRGCCNGKTYDTSQLICCNDGRVDISCEPQSDPCDPNPCAYDGVCSANPLTNVAECECKAQVVKFVVAEQIHFQNFRFCVFQIYSISMVLNFFGFFTED